MAQLILIHVIYVLQFILHTKHLHTNLLHFDCSVLNFIYLNRDHFVSHFDILSIVHWRWVYTIYRHLHIYVYIYCTNARMHKCTNTQNAEVTIRITNYKYVHFIWKNNPGMLSYSTEKFALSRQCPSNKELLAVAVLIVLFGRFLLFICCHIDSCIIHCQFSAFHFRCSTVCVILSFIVSFFFMIKNTYGIHGGLECINETFTFAEESSWSLVHETLTNQTSNDMHFR